jgi:hypothetical protein
MMGGLHANSKGPFTQRKHLVLCRGGGGAFKFKEERKTMECIQSMTEVFGSKKVVERKTRQQQP